MNHSVVMNQLMGKSVVNVLVVCRKGRLLEMLGLIVKIKKWIKESIELFNESEKFRIKNDLPHSADFGHYGYSEVR